MGLKKRVKALEEALNLALQRIEELEKKGIEKDKTIDELRNELSRYKNSNTPSSANKHLKPNTQGGKVKVNSKRGAPIGHKGKTRKQVPQRKEIVDCDECPFCHGHHLKDNKLIKQIIEEIQEPVAPEIIEGEIHQKKCLDCGKTFIPPQNSIPLKGGFGINLMIVVIFIKFILRGVLRKTSSFLEVSHAFDITPASINKMIKRVAEASENEYNLLKEKIRKSAIIYIDETSFSVLGKNQWVWVFRTETEILLVIRPSRGSNVLEEILGKDYSGTIICDCWRAYNFLVLANIQRCWSHLLRKSKELNSIAGKNIHNKLQNLFEGIKNYNSKNHSKEERLEKYDEMTEKLKDIIMYYSGYSDEIEAVIKYINFNIDNWFTCIKIEGIEPTNNFAEQSLRESVVVRKIIGAFRSETGKESYESLASVIASWQLKGLDLKGELKQMLIKNLCFC
jgi:hypothetical protein